MTADLSRMSPQARARARGCRTDIPCPESGEYERGIEAYWRGAELDDAMPVGWKNGWRAGQAGRKPARKQKEVPLWDWMRRPEPDKRFIRKRRTAA